jgi:thiamine pyrophosphokinase
VAFTALGGRFDQTIASINQLYFLKDEIDRQTLLVSDENLTILLDEVRFFFFFWSDERKFMLKECVIGKAQNRM